MDDNTNILVANTGLKPLVNYNFMLRVEGLYDVPCKSVRAFARENEFEYIQEGGLNDYIHLRRKPISKPFTFQVERYTGIDYFDPLPDGAELILPVLLLVSRYGNDFARTKRCYVFTGCTVMSKEYGALEAERSGLLVETSTIAYRELLCVDWPADQKKELWKMDGSGKPSARHNNKELGRKKMGTVNASKKEDISLIENPYYRKWEFGGTNKKEAGKQSAKDVIRFLMK